MPDQRSENPPSIPRRSPDAWITMRSRTPARVGVGRVGGGYRTTTQLELRRDHAAALDAVHAEIELDRDFGSAFVSEWRLFEVSTRAANKMEYLSRPDLGRKLSDIGREEISRRCPSRAELQVVIGDGLSAAAVIAQVPPLLLPLLGEGAKERGWKFGQPVFVRHCRVGILNDIGELLDPLVVVLLIGERPGLATAESLSAYLAYRPRAGHTDANRNLISNIHARSIPPEVASRRVLALAEQMIRQQASGVAVKEQLVNTLPGETSPLPKRGEGARRSPLTRIGDD